MIDVRMGQQHCVDLCGIKRKLLTITRVGVATALNEAAIDEQRPAAHPQDMARAGHLARRTEEFDFQASSPETSTWV